MTPYEQSLINRLFRERKSKACHNCEYYTSKDCGKPKFNHLVSNGGRWEKIPDERCKRGE